MNTPCGQEVSLTGAYYEINTHDYLIELTFGQHGGLQRSYTGYLGKHIKIDMGDMPAEVICHTDLNDVSEKFVLAKEGMEDFLYPRQAASEIRGVTIGTVKVMQGLQNIVQWKVASYTNIGYDLSEQHFAGALKVENAVDAHLLMCTVRVRGSLVDYHYPLCAKMIPQEPFLDTSGHYVMDVIVENSDLPCEVRGTAKPGQMIAGTVLVENLTIPGHLVYTAVMGNNTMCVGKVCKTFWHVPSYKDAIRTIVKMKRVIDRITYDWNLNSLKTLLGNKFVMLDRHFCSEREHFVTPLMHPLPV